MKRSLQAAETREALIEAAKRLFTTRGYLNTKITDITAEAGRSAGSFYNHFTGKQELLEALLAEVSAAGDRTAASAEHKADFTDPDAIRFHAAAYVRVHREHAATLLALHQASLVSEELAATLRRWRRAQLDDLRGHLRYVPDLPASPEATLALLAATFDSVTQPWSDIPEDEAVEAVTRFAYRALNGRDVPAPRET